MRVFRLMSGRTGIALVATYMLVLQSLIGAFAVGAAASSPMLDAFGNPLCITSSEAAEDNSDRSGHGTMPDCCTVSCSMFSSAIANAREAHSLHNPLEYAFVQTAFAFDSIASSFTLERGPGSPRSPPIVFA